MAKKINIRPTTSVYATYKNINYEIWTAIAEFVDNSTQSYYDYQKKLEKTKYWDGCEIEITYEKDDDDEYYLQIKDNAYGMDFNDFQRAIVLDSPPKRTTRSEFGMGLKTAACWFGKKWSVTTTELGSNIRYKTTVDVEALSKYKNEEIEVEEEQCSPKEHGTIIRIWKLNRTIKGRQVGKTKDMLRGLYRVDLRTGNIRIVYNEEQLNFEDPEVYTEKIENGDIIKWEKDDINFEIEMNEKKYHVTGKIAIRKKASVGEAGFTLIRRGRVIIGGYENNYRPEEIFGKSNSFEYQRLFGELNMDDWPVVQTKDNFDWNNGLEDLFIDKLKDITREYVKKAKKIRVRKTYDANQSINKMVESFKKAGIIENPIINDCKRDEENIVTGNNQEKFGSEEENAANVIKNEEKKITFDISGVTYTFNLVIDDKNSNDEWLKIIDKGEDQYVIKWNVKHVFFSKFIDEPKFISVMQNFIFAFAISEVQSRKLGINGQVSPGAIRTRMNEILKNVGSDYE